jgi:hypothetical protein
MQSAHEATDDLGYGIPEHEGSIKESPVVLAGAAKQQRPLQELPVAR